MPTSPGLLDSKPFINPGLRNLNASGSVDFDVPGPIVAWVFALDLNNGLRAFCLDSTPPVMNCPPGISVTASNVPGAVGAVVDYGVTATDKIPADRSAFSASRRREPSKNLGGGRGGEHCCGWIPSRAGLSVTTWREPPF